MWVFKYNKEKLMTTKVVGEMENKEREMKQNKSSYKM